jgi:type IV pilus assembly protein PilM
MNLGRLGLPFGRRTGAPEIGPIGLDLASDRLTMLQIEGGATEARIRAMASVSQPDGERSLLSSPSTLKKLVARAYKRGPFRGRRVVTALPPDRVKLMLLNYDLGAQQAEPELILSRVQERIQESVEDCVIDYLPIRKTAGKPSESSALVAIAREEVVIGHLELLRSARLEVEALEIGPVAVRRLVGRLAKDSARENVLVINFDRSRSYLIVLWGRRLILYREIDFGTDRVIELLSKSLDLTPEEAASVLREYGVFPGGEPSGPGDGPTGEEIRQTVMEILKPGFQTVAEQVSNAFVYAASRTRGESVDFVYLLGPVSHWPGSDRLLSELISSPVRALDPTAGLRGQGDDKGLMSPTADLALAAGLALRGMADGE